MSEVIERFDREHNAYNDISRKRRVDSMRVLREFEAHAGMELLAAGAPEITSYVASLVASGKAVGTVRKHLNLLRPFYSWAWRSGLYPDDKFMGIKHVRAPRGASAAANGKPRPYTRDEVKKLWADVAKTYPFLPDDYYLERFARGTTPWRRLRKHAMRLQLEAIFALALFGGMRMGEIYRAEVDDITPEGAYVVVRGACKNPDAEEKVRIVPWTTPDMKRMVGDWLAFREWLEPPHMHTWLSLHNRDTYLRPLRFGGYEMFASKLGRGWEYHRMRHTALTEMLRAGYPLHEVQRIAGHARLQQTLAYAELLPDDLIRTAARQSDVLSTALSPPTREEAA